MSSSLPAPGRRRNGQQLEDAILDAAWQDLVETGYGRLTMASVAARAHTSEPVLYRRWANKDELVFAALKHRRAGIPIVLPDTGTLRGDLLAELTAVGRALTGFYALAAAASLSGLLAGTGLTPAQVREKLMFAPHRAAQRPVYRRAAARGELDLERVPAAVLELPFDLARHDMLMTVQASKPARIRVIVDELFLPLVEHYRR